MASYTVAKVRMESSADGGYHEHIEGVCTTANLHYTRKAVVDSLRAGDTWKTLAADGSSAPIKEMQYCPHRVCTATPYITTDRDASAKDNLDNLPQC
jgi:hypothetical protein